ncbi:histidine phosphatase family protein [Mariprofundus sp. EBB-1]|uniref:histidine phosphatase family protein n=1 Tax=Mariprofundus sp. EBB-1 TaxID=2650971 RepID=UPI000EF1BBD0|nr:histidine phosphatase family protein [Mariprofundus sp. EBB-1]RLL52716.1 histidine phosphatase family protein [Mariprofundus sp. EBB-1]
MKKMKVLLATLCCAFFVITASAYAAPATEIYFARHGETVGNVTHHHTHENDRTFSEKGLKQVADLTQKLDALRFDYIIVSPKYRTLNTIFPYLKKHNLKAEVWPELEECCWQTKTSRLSSFNLQRGDTIRLEPKMRRYFMFPDDQAQRRFAAKNYGDGLLQMFKAVQLIRKRFAGTGKRILIVSHYHIGSRLMETLQKLEPDGRYKLSNGKISHLIEKDDGSYHLLDINQ